jgi:outer membrane protein OmpA-like peptidoglycan-associated protein
MLLLCFCLALVAAAGIARERELRTAAEAELGRVRAEASLGGDGAALRGLVEAEAARTGARPDDLWKRLVTGGRRASAAEPGEAAPAPSSPKAPAGPDPAGPATAAGTAPPTPAPKPEEGLIASAGSALSRLGRSLAGRHDWPPIVTLSEAAGFRFPSGSSALSPAFASALGKSVVPRLAETGEAYDVDVIEVVGHTDGAPVGTGGSNLDATLVGALRGHIDPAGLRAGDNAGLGLARAATVAAALRRDPRLDGYRIVPLSAGQAVGPDLRLGQGGSDASLRRIEIRMRKGPEPAGTGDRR